MSSDPSKKVNNPLFNAAVTGGTFEDFSQNALLLPAKEKPPPPILNITTDQVLTDNKITEYKSNILEPITTTAPPFELLPATEEINLQEQSAPPSTSSYFSSVFPAFTNILKITPKSEEEEITVPPPAGIDSFISSPVTFPDSSAPVDPIPLFPAANFQPVVPKQETTGPANAFRRGGLKRPTYAPVPGLSDKQTPTPEPPSIVPNLPPLPAKTPPTFNTPYQNYQQPTNQPLNFNPSSFPPVQQHDPVIPQQNQFNPITQANLNPQPFNTQQYFYQPTPSFPVQTNSNLQSPVMAAMPISEVQDANAASNTEKFTTPVGQQQNQVYRPVYHHWFFKKEIEGKVIWQPFSMLDSLALDQAFTSNDLDPEKVIATDGGRYDVNILRRQRIPVYWKGGPSEVRRCSWFYKKNAQGRYVPYEENVATMLEEEYKVAFEQNQWNKRIDLATGETVILHSAEILVVNQPAPPTDNWGNSNNQVRSSVVKRGLDDFNIEEGEPAKVDHLLFMVHGIGSVCDLKFRSVEEVVDEFRSIALQLVESHYQSSCQKGIANRIEVLPIGWHDRLHSEDTGVDKKLQSITLDSIPRLRNFTNDTLLDILFYTSPIYCQTVISAVGTELNRIFELFKKRNPSFEGKVSLAGHSLGSLILFDLLTHQHGEPEPATKEDEKVGEVEPKSSQPVRKISRRISYMMGKKGTGQPQIHYPHLDFQPIAFFALGSPIGMFVTVRGLENLGEQFSLPTCPAFFNIFHPYDPVAYRIESLINTELGKLKPVLIPHHKGRKRMHLELKETMARVGADLKERIIDSMKSTWNSFYQLAMFHRQDTPNLEEEVDKAFKEQIETKASDIENEEDPPMQPVPQDVPLGALNRGRRIDYVLQEAPFEFINEYIFALTSHLCYWESEDTILMILKEIYSTMNISADSQIPQQTMTIERVPSASPKSQNMDFGQSSVGYSKPNIAGMDPTVPIQQTSSIGPPPMSGFVKKT